MHGFITVQVVHSLLFCNIPHSLDCSLHWLSPHTKYKVHSLNWLISYCKVSNAHSLHWLIFLSCRLSTTQHTVAQGIWLCMLAMGSILLYCRHLDPSLNCLSTICEVTQSLQQSPLLLHAYSSPSTLCCFRPT